VTGNQKRCNKSRHGDRQEPAINAGAGLQETRSSTASTEQRNPSDRRAKPSSRLKPAFRRARLRPTTIASLNNTSGTARD